MMPSARPVYITIDPITEFEKHCVRYGMRFILIAYRGIVRLQTGAEIFDARRETRETALTDGVDDESYAAVRLLMSPLPGAGNERGREWRDKMMAICCLTFHCVCVCVCVHSGPSWTTHAT